MKTIRAKTKEEQERDSSIGLMPLAEFTEKHEPNLKGSVCFCMDCNVIYEDMDSVEVRVTKLRSTDAPWHRAYCPNKKIMGRVCGKSLCFDSPDSMNREYKIV